VNQVETRELLYSQPDQIGVGRGAESLPQQTCRLFGGSSSITALPNKRRGLIEAVSLMRFQIINQSFGLKFPHDKIVRARCRQKHRCLHNFRIDGIGDFYPCLVLKSMAI
jgi:hypothetical protein